MVNDELPSIAQCLDPLGFVEPATSAVSPEPIVLRRLPLDHLFVEGMRSRLDCAAMVDRLVNLTDMLTQCAGGKLDMSEMQISASKAALTAIGLALAKTMPDLKQTEIRATIDTGETARRDTVTRLLAKVTEQRHRDAVIIDGVFTPAKHNGAAKH